MKQRGINLLAKPLFEAQPNYIDETKDTEANKRKYTRVFIASLALKSRTLAAMK